MFVVKYYEQRTVIIDADQFESYVVPKWATATREELQTLADEFNSLGKRYKRAILVFEARYKDQRR
jgi:hypothetical protein